jgi:MFS family permease
MVRHALVGTECDKSDCCHCRPVVGIVALQSIRSTTNSDILLYSVDSRCACLFCKCIYNTSVSCSGLLISFGAKWAYPYFELLFIGRFIWGTANGIITITQTVWIIESAPVSQRGRVSSWQETIAIFGELCAIETSSIHIFAGNLATQAIGIPLSTHDLWPMMFVLPFVMNLICMVTFALLPESPQYLLFYRRDKNAVKLYNNWFFVKSCVIFRPK